MEKRYYWSKFKSDFMNRVAIKKLEKISGGATPLSLYLRLLAMSIDTEGVIRYQGIENTFEEEIALFMDADIQIVRTTLDFLRKTGLMEDLGDGQYRLPDVADNIGSECASAKRVRAYRERKKALQSNNNITEFKTLHCNREKEKELIERDINESCQNKTIIQRQRTPFVKPTIQQVADYIALKKYNVDAKEFWEFYEGEKWICNDHPMRSWKGVLYKWSKNQRPYYTKKASQKTAKKWDYGDFQQNTYDFKQLENDLIQN